MTQPPSPASRACANAEDFLDESVDFEDKDASSRHKLLKKARTLVYEMALVLQPMAAPAPAAATSSSTPVTFGDLQTTRDPIIEITTEEPQWQVAMLFAIGTAKRMGAESFEITVKEERSSRPQSTGYQNPFLNYLSQAESWQQSGACYRVTIYAVRIK